MRSRVINLRKGLQLAAGASLALLAVPAMAGTATSNLSVSASIAANCTISTTAVSFGTYDPVSANASTSLTANGAVSTTCTKGASATITLGQGSNPSSGSTAAAPVRNMSDGGTTPSLMSYQLYSDSGLTTVFDGSTGVAVTGTGSAVSTTVYGKVPSGQTTLPAGTYTDTVVATVSF